METKIEKRDWLFLLVCLLLGVLGEEAFFRDRIGISYLVFIIGFYAIFFWRFRGFNFSHQRLGYFILCCIWILAANFFLYDNMVFYSLNLLALPVLVIFHIVLITSPKNINWSKPVFIFYLFSKLLDSIKFNFSFAKGSGKFFKEGADEKKYQVWKKVIVGVAISIPVLFIVLNLLMSADSQFERIIGNFPQWFDVMSSENIFRCIVVLIYTFAFFGLMQVLIQRKIQVIDPQNNNQFIKFDDIIALTVLVLINSVYLLFVLVQFKYFFSGTLQGDYTYAQYARRGFFELLFVTMINLSITVFVISFVKSTGKNVKRIMKIMLSILILSSVIILSSAFMRMLMYEEAYGFTFTRVLVHSFMIFLLIIIAYTLVRIWLERISLFHFYFIAGLLYYTCINIINIDQIVVNENIGRYEQTGKIDIHYLNSLSYTGVLSLIDLYEKDLKINGLSETLKERQASGNSEKTPWQSYNLTRDHALKELRDLRIQ